MILFYLFQVLLHQFLLLILIEYWVPRLSLVGVCGLVSYSFLLGYAVWMPDILGLLSIFGLQSVANLIMLVLTGYAPKKAHKIMLVLLPWIAAAVAYLIFSLSIWPYKNVYHL